MDIARLPVPLAAGTAQYLQRVNRSQDSGQILQSPSRALQPQRPPAPDQAVQGELLPNQRFFYARRPGTGTFQPGTYASSVSSSQPNGGSGLQARRIVGAYQDTARLGTPGTPLQGRSVDYFV